MLQFHRYYDQADPAEFNEACARLCDGFQSSGDLQGFTLGLTSLLSRFPDHPKLLLMCLRALSWTRQPGFPFTVSQDFLQIFRRHLTPPRPHFFQQETLGVLGREFFEANALPLESFALGLHTQSRPSLAHPPSPVLPPQDPMRQPVYFLPAYSGFFSMVEAVLLMDFYATTIAGGRLVLAPESYWWKYEVSFREIYGSLFEVLPPDAAQGITFFDRNSVARWLETAGPDVQQSFFDFKCARYQQVHQLSRQFLASRSVPPFAPETGAVLYLRGGDKFAQETVPFPQRLIDEELRFLLEQQSMGGGEVSVLSDDWNLSVAITERFPGVRNLTRPSMKGHTITNHRSTRDVIEILENFLLLCDAPVCAACPSSNLVNAAHHFRMGAGRKVHTSRLFPVTSYLML
ncbi:MAG: hypothetical protein RLZZ142_2409 [Verrucomicrobiota bacterium]